jgi:hypothetical protein
VQNERRALGAGLASLVAIKLFIVLFYGPMVQPDSGGYITYADQILRDSRWLYDQPGGGGDASFRMVGYPALIAVFKAFLGDQYGYGILLVQAALGLAATASIYGFLREALGDWRWAFFATLCYATGLPLVFDTFILTDGVYGSVIAIAVASLGRLAIRGGSSAAQAVLVGVVLASAFLIREATLQLALAFVPLLVAGASGGAYARIRSLLLLALPVFVVAGLYMSWNQYRSNAYFVTTGMRTAALLPLLEIARQGAPVFDGDSRLDQAARPLLGKSSFEEVLQINRRLEAQGFSAIEADREVRRKYWQSLFRFPLAFARHALGHFNLHKRSLVFANPVRSAVHLEEFRERGELAGLASRVRKGILEGHYWLGLVVFVELAFSLISVLIGFFAFVVFPVRFAATVIREKSLPRKWGILGALWLLYFTFLGAYSMVYVEDRYLIGALPAILAVGLVMAKDALSRGHDGWLSMRAGKA